MKRLLIAIVLLLALLVGTPQAATIYVNNAANCSGSGTSESPYCSIQNAFNAVRAGGDIRIQNGGTEYNECADTLRTTGTATNPITIESDNPHNQAVLTCHSQGAGEQMFINGVNYVTIQNLTWDGAFNGVPSIALFVKQASSSRAVINGIQVLNNTFNKWGAANTTANDDGFFENESIQINGTYAGGAGNGIINGTIISGNIINGGRGWGIQVQTDTNTVVSNNLIENLVCGQHKGYGSTVGFAQGIENNTGTTGWVSNEDIKGNVIQNITSNCTLPGVTETFAAGIHCDDDNNNGTIEQNVLINLTMTGAHNFDRGIWIELHCTGWTVKNNIVNNAASGGLAGIYINPSDTSAANFVYNNTVANGSGGIRVDTGTATVQNNILYNNGVQIMFNPNNSAPPSLTSDYNIFWDTSGGNYVGSYNSYTKSNFATWKADTGGDSHSLNANPNLSNPVTGSNYNFRETETSDTVGAGLTIASVTNDFAGSTRRTPYDMGAYQFNTPIALPTVQQSKTNSAPLE